MTSSTLTWLDFSEDEQRRAREIVQLFSQRESRDELGIGTVRDAFSNLMFPGVSVIHTRPKYLLLIPWLFQKGAERGRTGPNLVVWVDRNERLLIETLRIGGDQVGLIGREAGVKVKTLPSTIYWNALQRYGILRWAGSIERVAAASGRRASIEDALTERVDRLDGVWDPYLPSAPKGFPNLDGLNFALSDEESSWLRERIASSCHETLLAWLITQRITPGTTQGPWDEPWMGELPAEMRRIVTHADLFSMVMNGAAILYNQLLAERCVELDIGRGEKEIDGYRDLFTVWQDQIDTRVSDVTGWDLADFWSIVTSQHPGPIGLSRRFIDSWIAVVRSGRLDQGALRERARDLVASREREQKRGQARLVNERLLRQWGGSSGIDRLTFRWAQVRRMLGDLNGEEMIDVGS